MSFEISRYSKISTCFLMLILLSLTYQVKAQFALSIALDRKSYLQHEPIFANVKIRNYSGRGLIFGKNKSLAGNLKFEIKNPAGAILAVLDPKINPIEGTVLNPGATKNIIVPISKMHRINKAGSYTIKAILSHPQLKNSFESKDGGFSIFNGITTWQRRVGVPDVLNLNVDKKIKERLIKLVNFYDGKTKVFVLAIEDDKFIYGIIRLANDIGNKPPQCEIDGLSMIHILAQVSPKIFSYYVYDINAKLEERDNFARSDQVNPRLVRDTEEGTVIVAGGRKAVKGQDYHEANYNPVFIENSK